MGIEPTNLRATATRTNASAPSTPAAAPSNSPLATPLGPRTAAATLPGFDRSPPQNGVGFRSPAVANGPSLTIPASGEALDPGDVSRLLPWATTSATPPMPSALSITADVARARLPIMTNDPAAASVVREGDHDYLSIGGRKIRLADTGCPPDPRSPIARIARLGPSAPADRPLQDVRVTIDPGHCGELEDLRSSNYVVPKELTEKPSSVPADALVEGDMAMQAARNLADRLTALGAKVTLIRAGAVSRQQGREELAALVEKNPGLLPKKYPPEKTLRNLDLERRAERIDESNPDILISLHFDSESMDVKADARKEVKVYVPGRIDVVATNPQMQAKMARQIGSSAWDGSVRLADTIVSNVSKATGQAPQSGSTLGDVDPDEVYQVGDGVFARNQRTQTSVRTDPVNVYIEGAMYSQPEVFAQLMADKGTPAGHPGGFIDTYAKAISDGVVTFVRAGGR